MDNSAPEKPEKTKLDLVVDAYNALGEVRGLLALASADVGTPDEIMDARTLCRLAQERLGLLLRRPLNGR